MKRMFAKIAVILMLCPIAGSLVAQVYPSRPIRIVVGFQIGGGTDITARVVGAKLQEVLAQPVIVDNKPGAGGVIAAEFVAKSPPDGYTLMMNGASVMTINPALYPKLSYDALRDFVPISNVVLLPFVVAVHPSVPANSIQEFIAYAKANPGKLNFSTAAVGGHVAGQMFNQMAGINIPLILYKGGAPAVTALIAGEVQMTITDAGSLASQIRAGRARALAVTTAKRATAMPELPTVAEAGIPGYETGTWFGLFAPAGTSDLIVSKLNAEVARIVNLPDVREKLAALGGEPVGGTSEQFAAQMRSEITRYTAAIKAANIKPE